MALAAGATLKYSGNPVQVLLSTGRPLTAAQRVAETLALEGTGLGLKCRLNSFSLRTARATRRQIGSQAQRAHLCVWHRAYSLGPSQ